jgi:phage terminase small subunit
VSTSPSPPRGTGPSGRALWRRIVADLDPEWELDQRDLEVLARAAVAADRIATLQKAITAEGLLLETARGPRLHPAAVELRQLETAFVRHLAQIDLEPDAKSQTARSRSARSAARALGGARAVTPQPRRRLMARLRAPAAQEPSTLTTAASARRFRSLRVWVHCSELGLAASREAELMRCGDLPSLERELDRSGLGDRARAHLEHLDRSRARWADGSARA